MPGRSWTNEEMTLLKEHYPETGSTVLRDRLDRSVKAINSQAYQFDLRSMEKYREWSDEEIKDLKRLYPNTSKDNLLNHFNHSWVSIWHKASRLGIYRMYGESDCCSSNKIASGVATDFEMGLIVGLLEADGAIYFLGGKNSLAPHIGIFNTNRELLEKTQKILGGSLYYDGKKKGKNHKDSYRLLVSGVKTIYKTLKKLQPHLTVKPRECDLILEFCKSRMSTPKNSPYTERERNIRDEVKALHTKGPRP